ncbi:HlyD family secretion protein [Rhodobacteraceae bacterium RKSG542]|uniref:HlyD family secretion protein n=1 Tax=Pseudovibrio flavus TaxID=2529854 RepID=UPI0012BBF631|nr:biotin/lipoyl-binding protein [Pseudovibrio flavus]MTI16212.1 HlyD family secretion protein [Pseudovibrio flavus]
MFEFLACSLITIFPDYLYRRYVQGKRIGKEINLFSVWYELKWGITACIILTVSLITMIFFYHPSTNLVSSYFRTISILPEGGGRVETVVVENNQFVKKGQLLFTLNDDVQQAQVETAQRKLEELNAEIVLVQAQIASAEGTIDQAQANYDQALQEEARKKELRSRNADVVTEREIETLENLSRSRLGTLQAAQAEKNVLEVRINTVLPADKASAEAQLAQAEAELAKKSVFAGVDGTLTQFILQPGDIVNPLLRPAGILIPKESGIERFQAGFQQITANILKEGMIGEITCASKPFQVIPMVIVGIQDTIPSGQFRPTDQLVDPKDLAQPGTVLAVMEPLYKGQALGIPPGSRCIANAYTNNHDKIVSEDTGFWAGVFYHMVDALAILHALILRMQAILLPVNILVLSGH